MKENMKENKNVHILVKINTKKELNSIRSIMEDDCANRISYDEIINMLIKNFTTANSEKSKIIV